MSQTADNASIFDVPSHYAFSMHRGYRARAVMLAQITAEVFDERALATVDLPARFRQAPSAFRVEEQDLSPEGASFARSHYPRWLANAERWPKPFVYAKAKRALERQLEQFAAP